MREWMKRPPRPRLTVMLGLVWAGCLWWFFFPGEATLEPRNTFAWARWADTTVLVAIANKTSPDLIETVSGIDDESLLEDSVRCFDDAMKRGTFPKDAAANWALLFYFLGDPERAHLAWEQIPIADRSRDPAKRLLHRLLNGERPLPKNEIAELAAQYLKDPGTLPEWYLLAYHGGDQGLKTWIERQGRILIRRGLAGDGLFFLFTALGSAALLVLFFRRKSRVSRPRPHRIERRWNSWRFFQEFFTAETLALIVSFLVSLPYFLSGAVEAGLVLSITCLFSIPVAWLLTSHMPGIRAGLAYLMPETRVRSRQPDAKTRLMGKVLFQALAGLGGLILVCMPLQLLGVGISGLRDILNPESLDTPFRVLIIMVYSVILAPFAEEIVFRGFLYGALRSKLGVATGAVISSVFFAAIHGYTVAGSCSIFLSGLVFATIYEKSGSLLPGMVAHGAFNLAITAQISGWFSFH